MPTVVIMPALGLAQDTGKVLRWLRAEGETVTRGEPLVEVETDKVTVEVEAPASGVLAGVRARPGDVVPVGHPVAVILAPGEPLPADVTAVATPGPLRAAEPPSSPPPAPGPPAEPPAGPGRIAASPLARRLARELGVDLSALRGSGPAGEITAEDVRAAAAGSAGRVWQVMVERLTRSWTTAPHFYLRRDVSAHGLVARRRRLRDTVPELTYTDLLVQQTAAALRQHPRLLARWEEGRLVASGRIHIGLAVAIPDGLVVPVLHDADALSLAEIARRRADLITRAQAGRLRPEDLRDGTFTISNLGMFDVDAFYPILNPPQAAILGVGRIADRVVAVDGRPAVRPVLSLTLSCDHRVIDGAGAARFLDTLARALESLEGEAP
ncbi:MAG: dihydrolipoamide acetyltransferase family protein [Armatimonadota bacterium]|nr:dihydrolipoamide acetyltransferase family protein [Armatimonadota bacterium]MDR7529004.1 dihydrolipoamide acetyltransferase family protein [Armatimonadota bacterium]